MRCDKRDCAVVSRVVCCVLVTFLVGLASCGGSGGTGGSIIVPPPVISVTITSHPAGVNAGLSYRFVASVQNTSNSTVTWTINCSCSGSDIGTIAADGTYTAPSSVTQQLTLRVMATSAADSTKSASVQFTLVPAIEISMNLAPSQMVLGFSQQFSANVQNDLDSRGVQWFVEDIAGGNAKLGTIDRQGTYTAPAGSSETTMHIVAKSATDPTKTASATVMLIVNPHPNFMGDYAFNFIGPNGLSLTGAAGTIHLDGAGRLSAALDINSVMGSNMFLTGLAVTGFYSFEHNNLGHATLSYTMGQQTATMSFRLALLSDEAARIMEFDGQGEGTGMIEKQTASGLSSSLDGSRVLALSGLNVTGQYNPQVNLIGAFTGSAGSLSGIFDTPGYDQTAFTGNYSFGSEDTLTLNLGAWNNGAPVTFHVYPVSPDKAFVLSTGMPVLSGVIEKQTGGPYSLAAFKGTWVFPLKATDSSYRLAGVRLVRIQADGSGLNASGDMYDNNSYSVLDGPPYPVTFARYYVAENGRGNANAQFAMPEPVVWYWVEPTRGYIISQEGSGEFFLQEGAPFGLSSLQAQLSFDLYGFSDYFFQPKSDSLFGIGTPDGNGNFVLITADIEEKDVADPIKMEVTRTGSYTIDSDGRGILSLDSGQFVLRFYAVSNTRLLLMRPGYDVIGVGTAERPSFAADLATSLH